MENIKREGGISLDDFYKFCKEMNEHHAFGVMGPTFAVKYIDSCVDTRDGEVWMVTLRDIVADDDIWAKIPEDWKRRSGTAVHISSSRIPRPVPVVNCQNKSNQDEDDDQIGKIDAAAARGTGTAPTIASAVIDSSAVVPVIVVGIPIAAGVPAAVAVVSAPATIAVIIVVAESGVNGDPAADDQNHSADQRRENGHCAPVLLEPVFHRSSFHMTSARA